MLLNFLALLLLAATAVLLVMYLRAKHDPMIDQGERIKISRVFCGFSQ